MVLKSVKIINSHSRIPSIDILRAIAILSVVIYHFFPQTKYGFLGVDLFFLISGLLIGGILIKDFENKKLNYFKFILRRGFKIWPSYYFFLIIGLALNYWLYSETHPLEVVKPTYYYRYFLFIRNYTGLPFYIMFEHVWSLCVEEHFYIVLPFMFLFIRATKLKHNYINSLFVMTIATICLGFIFKLLSFYFTNSKDTTVATHNRIDALAWGVLIALLVTYKKDALKKYLNRFTAIIAIALVAVTLYLDSSLTSVFFHKILLPTIIPSLFFVLIASAYYIKIEIKILNFIAYYSYNWYLWHPIFILYIKDKIGSNWQGFIIYLVVSFFLAAFTTILIEEPFLKLRNKWIK